MDRAKAAPGTDARFTATRWSVVLAAQATGSPAAEAALARLCEAYWYPVYAFLRRKGNSCHQAEDLTQGFFAHVLRREWLRNVGPEKGRFRTFVLRCLTNYVASQRRQPVTVPIDLSDGEQRYLAEPVDSITPEKLFELRWAVAVLDQSLARLRLEAADQGRVERFDALAGYLARAAAPGNYAELAGRLGVTEDAARQEVSRLRKRYREAIRSELAETVSGREEIQDELNHLMRVLSQ